MAGHELSILNLDAIHAAQLAEWTDGIRVIRDAGRLATQDSASYVHVSKIPDDTACVNVRGRRS